MQKKIIIFTVLVVLFTFGIVLFSVYQTQKITRETEKIIPAPIKREEIATKRPRRLIPSRPEDYGMIVIDENNKPQAQEGWDNLLSPKFEELKAKAPPERWDKIKEKIREEPQKTQEKLKQIDDSIKQYQEILRQDPNNQEIKGKLERLMMLKSITKELPQ